MGTELLRACLKEEDLDFPELPPGFESFTSFKMKKIGNTVNEPSCSDSSSISHHELRNVKPEPGHAGAGKVSRSLRRRTGVNYGRLNHCSDEDSDSEKLCQNSLTSTGLPKGVIRGCSDCQNCQKVIARWRPEAACRLDLEEVPVFYPTEEEFRDTIRYIQKLRPKAEQYGICRIIPPPSWKPPCALKEEDIWKTKSFATRVQKVDKLQNRDISRKIPKTQSLARKKRKRYARMGVECAAAIGKNSELGEAGFGFEPGPEFTLDAFQRYADDFKAQYFRLNDFNEKWEPSLEAMEGEYWRVVEKPTEEIEVLYGADLETGVFGSGFLKSSGQCCSSSDEEYVKSGWNLNNLPRLPGSVLSYENADISGVQVPWLYVGMCFSSFCWHVEDHHLYSLNYMHFGEPKMWYGVPGVDATKLEDAMKKYLPDLFDEQPDLLHKLITQLSPSILKSAGVPVYRCVQNEGEFVLTFPRAYHAGFNCGFNCAEAVNVAPIDWLPHGQNAVELYREQGRKTTISHDKLLLGAAREAVKANWELNLLRKNTIDNLRWKDVCGKEGILAKSLRARVETEKVRREFLCKNSKELKMESNFDSTTERECSICFFDLHLSAAGCRCSPDRFACLNHAKQLCSCGSDDKFFLFRYDIAELNVLVDALEGKLSAIYRWARLDLGLALSSCIAKDNGQVGRPMGPNAQHPGENCANRANSQPLVTSQVKIPNDSASSVAKPPSEQQGKGPGTVLLLALEATRIPPIKLPVYPQRKNDPTIQIIQPESQKKFPHGQVDVICLSDDEDEKSDKPPSSPANENVPDMMEGSDHRLNLCDLANAALAAEADLNLISDGQKDDCFSCSTSPKDENDMKCEAAVISDEQNLSSHHGSVVGSVQKRDHDTSTPDSSILNINSAPSLGHCEKVRDENVIVQRSAMKLLDDVRILPRSPSCCQSSVDKCHHQKGPRIAKVIRRINCNVELLEPGAVVSGNLWNNSQAIFSKGFKSRVKYINISEPTNMCSYISEILDRGSKGPLFMVYLEHSPSDVFAHLSPTKCWEMVRERVNQEITRLHKLGTSNLPPLQPPGSLDGLEMFGFTSPAIVQAIEALDKNRVCTEYWSTRPLAQISHCFQLRGQNQSSVPNNLDTILRGLFKKANPEELHSLMENLSNNQALITRLLNEELQHRSR